MLVFYREKGRRGPKALSRSTSGSDGQDSEIWRKQGLRMFALPSATIYLMVTVEQMVERNPVKAQLNKWTFGQTLALIMLIQQLIACLSLFKKSSVWVGNMPSPLPRVRRMERCPRMTAKMKGNPKSSKDNQPPGLCLVFGSFSASFLFIGVSKFRERVVRCVHVIALLYMNRRKEGSFPRRFKHPI
ncbi:hypothetical protein RSAG8_12966, partial [Rhizoctonia solani AG-8 WAC10335]